MGNAAIRTETFGAPENHSWLGKSLGLDQMDSITLDGDALLVKFPDGVIPSGIVLGRLTATVGGVIIYVPYDDAVATGAEVARGHLGTSQSIGTAAGQRITAPLLWYGEVIEAKLPTGHGLDAAAKVDLPRIKYV